MRPHAAVVLILALVLPLAAAVAAAQQRDEHGNILDEQGRPVHVNALILEASPYLQQHAHNPVQWLPWGEEAFKKAREENKPIFLSIGYSTCHWCHVMARQSFSDEEVAAVLNAYFVPIKVDREERPDVDDVYMSAVQILKRRGGWPLSAWLTPELEPFEGGTYYPRDQFLSQLTSIAAAWSGNREELEAQAHRVAAGVRQNLATRRAAAEVGDEALSGAVARMGQGWDDVHAGWGVPKFPHETTILFLLDRWETAGDARALELATRALDAMQEGGIHDQVGGGFHRYATDAQWLVPHFEKMLYNQAWLGRCYLEAWRLTGKESYRRSAEGVLRYIVRDMTDPGGGFHSAEDADSEGEEGIFYLWRPADLVRVLGEKDATLAAAWFGVTTGGNFREAPGTTILTARQDAAAFATGHGLSERDFLGRLDAWREALVRERATRVRPHLDDKVLADWNGMMIGTFARASVVLGDAEWRKVAERAATFALRSLRDKEGRLLHGWRGSAMAVPGFLDDHAALVDGLVELHDATDEARWLDAARSLHAQAREQFRDPADGACWRTGPWHQALLARSKTAYDGARPSGNGLMAWNAVRLWRRTGDSSLGDDAAAAFRAFSPELARGSGAETLLRGLQAWREGEAGPVARDDGGTLTARLAADRLEVEAGGEVNVTLQLDVASGWHVGAAKPEAEDVRPTTVTVAPPFVLSSTKWPVGKRVTLDFATSPVRLYEGRVELTARLSVPAGTAAGPAVAHLDLVAQSCNDTLCLAAATLILELPLVIRPEPSKS